MSAACRVLFEQDRAWSVPIDGPTIAFVIYDPVCFSLEVVYHTGALVLLGNVGQSVTTQIVTSPNREQTVLGLVKSAQHIGMPVNLTPPSIIGLFTLGTELFAYVGTWCYAPASYRYQWHRNGVSIAGATGAFYQVQSADIGTTLSVTVIAINAFGPSQPATGGMAPAPVLVTESGVIITTEGGEPIEA